MNIHEAIEALATEENAREYEATSEKFLFCDDLFTGLNIRPNEAAINALEDRFDAING